MRRHAIVGMVVFLATTRTCPLSAQDPDPLDTPPARERRVLLPRYRTVPQTEARPRATLIPPPHNVLKAPQERQPQPYQAANEPARQERTQGTPRPGWLAGHLEIGLRSTTFSLKETDREAPDSFLGSVNRLEADPDARPNKVDLTWMFNRYAGIDLTHDQIRARTRTTATGHTDGTVVLSGPILSGLVRYPVPFRLFDRPLTLRPWAGVGFAFLGSEFAAEGWWHEGFGRELPDEMIPSVPEQQYRAWLANGAPPWPNDGYRRNIALSAANEIAVSGGVDIQITEHWAVECLVRVVKADIDVHYTRTVYDDIQLSQEDVRWPVSHTTTGMGLRYLF